MKVWAVSVGEQAGKLGEVREGSCFVHSAFRRALNISADGELFTVCRRGLGRSATVIVIMEDLDFMTQVAPGSPVWIEQGAVRVGSLEIDVSMAAVWRGRMNENIQADISSESVAILKSVLDRRAAPGSAWRLLQSGDSFCDAVDELIRDGSLRKLIGRGVGLTPSGDDFVLGYMAAVNHISALRPRLVPLHEAVSASLKATNDISAAMLKQAMRYGYHEYLDDLCHVLLNGEEERLAASAARLTEIGATSGSDMLTGVYMAAGTYSPPTEGWRVAPGWSLADA